MTPPDSKRTDESRVRSNLGIPQPAYHIQSINDLLKIPQDRRVVACQALARWLIDPNTRTPKTPWFSFRYWLGGQFAEFVWEDDGRILSDEKLAVDIKIDAREAIDIIRQAISNMVDQAALPKDVLTSFDQSILAAEAPQRAAEAEERAEKAIAGLIHEYGLRQEPAPTESTIWTLPPKFGSTDQRDRRTATHDKLKRSQVLEHLHAWLRHHAANVDTISAMRRQLRSIPPGWTVQFIADVAGTTVGTYRLFQPVPGHEAEHPRHGISLSGSGGEDNSEFAAYRRALAMFIDTKTLASARMRFGDSSLPFAGFPGAQKLTDSKLADPAGLVGHDGHKWPRTMDAVCWAAAWIAHITLYPEVAKDEGAMLGWFANAIMAGYDTAEKRAAEKQLSAAQPPEAITDLDQYMAGWTSGAQGHEAFAHDGQQRALGFRHGTEARDHARKLAEWAISSRTDEAVEAGPTAGKRTPLDHLRNFVAIQGNTGNWDYSEYMLGLFNGLELALATFEDREPVYRKMPETGWLEDKPRPEVFDQGTSPETLPVPAVAAGLNADQWTDLVSRRTGLPVEDDGAGKNATTAAQKVRVAHWMRCTAEWNIGPSMFFRVGDAIEMDSADFDKQMATLVLGDTTVTFDYLLAHAEPMTPQEVVERGLQAVTGRTIVDSISLTPEELAIRQQPATDLRIGGVPVDEFFAQATPADLPLPDGPVAAPEPPPDTKGHEAIQALEVANPNAPGLIGAEAPGVPVFIGNVLGQFARHAVLQSPYSSPDGLADVLAAIDGDIRERFDENGIAMLNLRDLENMLNEAIMALPQVSAWNQRKNGNTSEFISATPGKRDPDDSFIDIQALIGNTALACIRESVNPTAGIVVGRAQQPQEHGATIGLWRYSGQMKGTKYLVLRRDGSVPVWPWFILGARDAAAVQAMAAYAWYAALLGYPAKFVADCERLAREMAAYQQANPAGDPAAGPDADRKDAPWVIHLMQRQQRGVQVKINGPVNISETTKP